MPKPKGYNQDALSGDFEFQALRHAVNYQRWLIKELGESIGGRTIEIGAGIGQMTAALRALSGISHLQSVEPEAVFCERFRLALPGHPLIQGTIKDVSSDDWHSIVSINVLEHIEDDQDELTAYQRKLRSNKGVLALFVPARPELYAPIDRDFGHYRRYDKRDLRSKLRLAGFTIEKMRYFDFVGYFAWHLNFCLLKRRNFDPRSVRLFDRLIFPVENFIESNICPPPFGKNLLVIARAS